MPLFSRPVTRIAALGLGVALAGIVLTALVSPSPSEATLKAVQLDVLYGKAGGTPLLLDVYGAQKTGKHPALVLVHGGGWAVGSKADMSRYGEFFASQGFVCFAVDYRLASEGHNLYPAQVDDVQRAVRWVRAHAATYGVDPKRLGALGESAGGHLVALLGTRETRDKGRDALAPYSSRVQCVVDVFGPSDFGPMAMLKPGEKDDAAQILHNFIGKTWKEAPGVYREASPLSHVSSMSAPFLLFHGAQDPLVPLDQSQRLDKALRAAGVESKLVVFQNEGHGFHEPKNVEALATQSLAFFKRHLKP